MAPSVVHAVSNTSPVNYLILIDEIGILPQLYGQVLVPQAVVNELGHVESPSIVKNWAAQPPAWVKVGIPTSKPDTTLADLGARSEERRVGKECRSRWS